MTRWSFLARSLNYYKRAHVAVGLGIVVAAATLTGALLVGDSMRGSLRDLAVGRLGRVDQVLVSSNFFREALASEISSHAQQAGRPHTVCPAILARGGMSHATTAVRVAHINVLGVNDQFWNLASVKGFVPPAHFTGHSVLLNEPLARELDAHVGDDVLLRLGKPTQVSTETLLGRRDDTSVTIRLPVVGIVSASDIGGFSLSPKQSLARNAFVPLQTLQRAFGRAGRVSALLVAKEPSTSDDGNGVDDVAFLNQTLAAKLTIEDLGLSLRTDETRGYVALETQAVLIEPGVERAVSKMATQKSLQPTPVLTYLANEISKPTGAPSASQPGTSPASAIPYSTISAIALGWSGADSLTLSADESSTALKSGDIVLNQWAAEDLNAQAGDRIDVAYYLTTPTGALRTVTTSFTLRGIAPMNDAVCDPGFTPTYKGITDTQSLSQWDPPFPIDLRKVRKKDDEYWKQYHATPKAFISLEDGRRLWAEQGQRLGRATSIRFYPHPGQSPSDLRAQLESALRSQLDPKTFNMSFDPIRNNLRAASEGSTDFGMLFVSFSFFLLASSAMLIALLYRLGMERRAAEIGTLLAAGWSPAQVGRTIILEGAVVAVIGSLLGLGVALGYAQLMLMGLGSWWVDAVNTPFLTLHVSPVTLAIGFVASLGIAIGSMTWSVRGLSKRSPRALISGSVQADSSRQRRKSTTRARTVTVIGLTAAVVLALGSLVTDAIPKAPGFFGTGAAMLMGCLGAFAWRLASAKRPAIIAGTRHTLRRLGAANCARNPGRSLLTVGLIASATFLVVSLEAFRLEPEADSNAHNTGTGGYELLAESAAPLAYDLNTPQGRQALGLDDSGNNSWKNVEILSLRLRPGDESSCLNLYRPNKPRIIGASDAMIARGGFRFSKTLAENQQQSDNPWTLLNKTFQDGAIPVIGDEAAVLWQLHAGLGQDMVIKDHHGQDVTIRFVALLSNSVLQDELIVAQTHFVELFPDIQGSTFFLIDTAGHNPRQVRAQLERELSTFGFDATSTRQRLRQFLAVQNTYLGTFQMLGGLGLVLGTVGLAVVMLRNTWERRSELALLRALGFARRDIRSIVLAENAALVWAGLVAGTVPAIVAITPALLERASTLPWGSIAFVLLGVALVGLGVSAIALHSTLRTPLLAALRSE